jgi:hypothetical protein
MSRSLQWMSPCNTVTNTVTNTITNTAALTLTLALLNGCANISDGDRTRAEAAGTGAAIGAVVGNLAGRNKESTLLGAALGAAIGGIVGDKTAKDKARYASIEDQLRTMIATAEQSTLEAHQINERLAKDILALQRRQSELLAQNSATAAQTNGLRTAKHDAEKLINKTATSIAAVDRQLTQQRKILDEQRQVVAAAQNSASSADLIMVADTKIDSLSNERAVLAASLDQLRLIDQRRAY